jgi:uncharacterized protein YjbI with pentapeptide repeats
MSDDEQAQEPDDTEPTPGRQAELRAAYEKNQTARKFWERMFRIRTRGELTWLIREHGWSGEVDDQRQNRVQLCVVSFHQANLRGAHLYMARLQDSNFDEADLSGAILIGAHLLEAGFEGATLRGAHLAGVYLPESSLYRANLEGANLRHADLSYANVSQTNLQNADLFGANLSHTNLSGADLRGADMRASQIDQETIFDGVTTDAATRLPRGACLPSPPTEQK